LTRFWHAVEQNRRVPLREVSRYARSHVGARQMPSRSAAELPSTIASPVAMPAAQPVAQSASAVWKCRCHGSPSWRLSVGTAPDSRSTAFSSTHARSGSPSSAQVTTCRRRVAQPASPAEAASSGGPVHRGSTPLSARSTAARWSGASGRSIGRPRRSPGVTSLISATAASATALV
jgi:hypothetical protein